MITMFKSIDYTIVYILHHENNALQKSSEHEVNVYSVFKTSIAQNSSEDHQQWIGQIPLESIEN